jgi:hypothetical protein
MLDKLILLLKLKFNKFHNVDKSLPCRILLANRTTRLARDDSDFGGSRAQPSRLFDSSL